MRSRWRGIALLAAALISASGSRPARADNDQDTAVARDLFREGAALAQQGKWEQALDRYARSLKLKRASLTLYSMGVAQKQLGQLVEARRSFTAFLAEPSSTATQPFEDPAKAAIAEIGSKLGSLTIQILPVGVPDLVVKLDGERISPSELGSAQLANPGSHEIRASGTGYAPSRLSVTVPEGGPITAALTLHPGEDMPVEPPPAPEPPPDRTFPAVLMGTGVSIFTTGAVVGTLGLLEARDAASADSVDGRHARSKELIGGIVGGTGLLMVGVGVIVYLTNGPTKPVADAKKTAFIAPWASGGASGVEIRF